MQVPQQEVTVAPLPNGKWKVTHKSNWGDAPGGAHPYPKVELPEKSGAHLIVFNLDNGNNDGSDAIKFSAASPFWVRKGAKPDGNNYTEAQFPLYKLQNDGKQLIIAACNDIAGEFQYQLNVTGQHESLDPVIVNGGGIKPTGYYSLAEVAVVAAVAAAASLIVGAFLQKKYKFLG